MDLGALGTLTIDWAFLSGFFNIIIINLILSGDNAVVIAMAVQSLPRDQRSKGIMLGAGIAVLLRIVFTFFVAQLLQVHLLKFVGGLLITWIAVKIFTEGAQEETHCKQAVSVGQVVRIILVADVTMSLDNVLGVAGASNGNLFLLIFGLGLSIPFVVFASNLLSMLMEKYPIIAYLGAAVLGKVGGEMVVTDPFVVNLIGHGAVLEYSVEAVFAVGVIVIGKLWMRAMMKREKDCRAVPEGRTLSRVTTK